MDLLASTWRTPSWPTRTSPRRPSWPSPTTSGANARWPRSCCKEGATADYESLRAFLADEGKIAKWQLPERWTIIESVPKTSVGKFDKKVIRKQYAEGELDVTKL